MVVYVTSDASKLAGTRLPFANVSSENVGGNVAEFWVAAKVKLDDAMAATDSR